MRRWNISLINHDERGGAVVEATILFPIMIMILAGLILLSIYLPGRAQLQRATQYVATGIATARSDDSIAFTENGYAWRGGNSEFPNVYAAMFSKDVSNEDAKKVMVEKFDSGLIAKGEGITVECGVNNYLFYKEVYVTATRSIRPPVDLTFVGFPETIDMTVTSTAVVQNGDEFIRNLDMAVDFPIYLIQKLDIDLPKAMEKIQDLLDLASGS